MNANQPFWDELDLIGLENLRFQYGGAIWNVALAMVGGYWSLSSMMPLLSEMTLQLIALTVF